MENILNRMVPIGDINIKNNNPRHPATLKIDTNEFIS